MPDVNNKSAEADWKSKIYAFGEGFANFVGTLELVAINLNKVVTVRPNWYGIGFGTAFGLVTGYGGYVCHAMVAQMNQEIKQQVPEASDDDPAPESYPLPFKDWLALGSEAVAHAMGAAGLALTLGGLVTDQLALEMPLAAEITLEVLGLLLGIACAHGEVRNARNSMYRYHSLFSKKHDVENPSPLTESSSPLSDNTSLQKVQSELLEALSSRENGSRSRRA
jgi:hypothetical protein